MNWFQLSWVLAFIMGVTSLNVAHAACRQALVLGLDVSGSVDMKEYQLQLFGLSNALLNNEVKDSLFIMPEAPVKLLVFEWSGPNYQKILLPWTKILNEDTLKKIVSQLRTKKRQKAPPTTALGNAIQTGISFLNQQTDCWKRTLDISGDGKSNSGPEPHQVNQPDQIGNITINGLIIGVDTLARLSHEEIEVSELVTYFSNRVLAGPGAFSEVALGFADYERAMVRKLVQELEFLGLSMLN